MALGEDGYMSPALVASRSGLSLKTVYRAIESGALCAYQPTKRYLISEAAYQAWVTQSPAARAAEVTTSVRPATAVEVGSYSELLAIEREAA
jgi:excisionase family DNA binding protein